MRPDKRICRRRFVGLAATWLCACCCVRGKAGAADVLHQYYAHPAVEDRHGVIAPWHAGQNGQLDERLRIAVELYKRYPWAGPERAVIPAPHIVYNTHWGIAEDGSITIPPTQPWMCGDLSQRALSIIQGLTAYYRYSGDPIAFVYIPLTVDYILDYCVTGPEHPWPRFPISTPIRGAGYGRADPGVPNQLDLCALMGTEVLRAYRLLGTPRYREAARHWADLIAEKCNVSDPRLPPWSRYVSPEYATWSDELTGSTALIAWFLDEVIRDGYTGKGGVLVRARDAAHAYLRDRMLPRWTEAEIWGRHYWDVEGDWLEGGVPWICEYLMDRPEIFPNWRSDVRNVLSLALHRNCVDPNSRGEVYSGAWAIPESCACCGTSLSYNQYTYAPAFLLYGERADDEWGREIGRRMILMATYDSGPTGVVRDGVAGEIVAAADWLNLAHPWPLCQILKAMAIRPDLFAPARENHIVHSRSVVTCVTYDKGRVAYRTFDAPSGSVDVIRLAFEPEAVTADGRPLSRRNQLDGNGYAVRPLPDGDRLVSIRHDGCRDIVVTGADPQEIIEDRDLRYAGPWSVVSQAGARDGGLHVAAEAGAEAVCAFAGNQVRVIGSVGPDGGQADVYLDGQRQLTLVEGWAPFVRRQQVLYSRSGLPDGPHELKLIARGKGNPASRGTRVCIDLVQYSSAKGRSTYGEGGGPTGWQRMVCGYPDRMDYIDSSGHVWRPATECVIRLGAGADAVARAWYTDRRSLYIGNTSDPELYRYGLHGGELCFNITVGPGCYDVGLHFADTNTRSAMRVLVNGRVAIERIDVAEEAGGRFRALKRTIPHVRPAHGIIEIRFIARDRKEACIQAIEVGPCRGAHETTAPAGCPR